MQHFLNLSRVNFFTNLLTHHFPVDCSKSAKSHAILNACEKHGLVLHLLAVIGASVGNIFIFMGNYCQNSRELSFAPYVVLGLPKITKNMNGSVFGVRNQVNKNEFLQLFYYIFIRFVSSNRNMMSQVPAYVPSC